MFTVGMNVFPCIFKNTGHWFTFLNAYLTDRMISAHPKLQSLNTTAVHVFIRLGD